MNPRLLLLFPGPVHTPERLFKARLEGLSRYFDGSVVAFGSESKPRSDAGAPPRPRMGRFDITLLGWLPGRLARARRMLEEVRELAASARSEGRPFDLIVSYEPLLTGLTALRAARGMDIKLVVEVNGDYWAASHYTEIANPIVRELKRCFYVAVERFVLKRSDGIKLLYPTQLEPLRGVVKSQHVAAFSDYVNTEAYRNLGHSDELLMVGFPFHVKGVDVLIEAFKRISDRFPDWKLKILGWYPGEELAYLQRAIGAHPRIQHHPPVSHELAAEHIGRCGILVLPSRTEGMGRVLLEAMAAGKPRVGSRVGGIPTVIEHEVDGLLVPPEDPAALADTLARLMADPVLRERLGASGARRAREEFNVERYFERQRDLYHRVLGRPEGSEGPNKL